MQIYQYIQIIAQVYIILIPQLKQTFPLHVCVCASVIDIVFSTCCSVGGVSAVVIFLTNTAAQLSKHGCVHLQRPTSTHMQIHQSTTVCPT